MAFKDRRGGEAAGKKQQLLRQQDGSAMVEAATVFPIVVLTMLLLIYGMIYLFDETAASSAVRRAAVREAGRQAGTVTLFEGGTLGVPVEASLYGVRPCTKAEKTAAFRSHMPGVAGRRQTLSAHQYIYNEKTEIRLWDLFQ